KQRCIPDIVTAGGPTIGLRAPAHAVAQMLLRAAGLAVAAPSANRSTRLSPTRAEHVLHDLNGRIDMVLDGGPTSGSIESTVLDVTTQPPRVLRPGLVTAADIEATIGHIDLHTPAPSGESQPLRSPGMGPRHYAPRAPLEILHGDIQARLNALQAAGIRLGMLAFGRADTIDITDIDVRYMPTSVAEYSAELYAT